MSKTFSFFISSLKIHLFICKTFAVFTDKGVVEAAQSMGASPFQIMTKVLLPEATPSLLLGFAIAVTTILGYSAMAGICGAGGLGAIAINYGYYRGDKEIMYVMVVLLVAPQTVPPPPAAQGLRLSAQ